MAKKNVNAFSGKDLFFALIMLCITAMVVLFGNRVTYLRNKAYLQTPVGVRIEAEELTLLGNVSKDPGGSYIQF